MTYISRNKEIFGGAPVIAGTRIPAERIVALLEHGYTEKNLRREFPGLPLKKIRGALKELASVGLENI